MKIIKNEKLIQRNSKIGQWTSLAALVTLGAGMYISFTKPEWFSYSILCLILGFMLTQIGMYMGNRWGRSPRPDEKLDASLKGLHSDFNMYHYATPASHLLVGPGGIWVILPFHQKGKIEFTKNRWRLSGGGFLQGYMRIFGQEGIGRPEIEANTEIESVKKFLTKKMDGNSIPEVKSLFVFTDEGAEVIANDSPIPAMGIKQLKEFLRNQTKARILNTDQIKNITDVLAE